MTTSAIKFNADRLLSIAQDANDLGRRMDDPTPLDDFEKVMVQNYIFRTETYILRLAAAINLDPEPKKRKLFRRKR